MCSHSHSFSAADWLFDERATLCVRVVVVGSLLLAHWHAFHTFAPAAAAAVRERTK